MKIAVVDDIDVELKKASAFVYEYAKRRGTSCEVSEFSSGEDFLAAVSKDARFDIALLDIFMSGITGIEAAKELRKTDSETELIFLTTSCDFALEAYSVYAANYLVKPFTAEQLDAALDRIFKEKPSEKQKLTLRCGGILQSVELDKVEYFEVQSHNFYVYLSGGEQLSARLTMKAIKEEIGGSADFISCGASFLVNLKHIRAASSLTLTMKSGRKIQVPRRSVSEVEKAYLEYCRRSVVK